MSNKISRRQLLAFSTAALAGGAAWAARARAQAAPEPGQYQPGRGTQKTGQGGLTPAAALVPQQSQPIVTPHTLRTPSNQIVSFS